VKLAKLISSLVDPKVVEDVAPDAKVWTPWRLVLMGLLMAWQDGPSLAKKFDGAWTVLRAVFPHTRLGGTYQGVIKALVAHSPLLLDRLSEELRVKMPTLAGPYWALHGWCAFAVDGSRVECPRTAANQQALGCAGRKKTGPQLFLTTVYHLGSGLPWSYRIGPGTDSERNHLRAMLGQLPGDSLLVADAGFVGYDLLAAIRAGGRHFLIRVGSNVTLLKKLGWGRTRGPDVVHLWPKKAAKKDQPPLVLRLITLHDGRKPVYLVTDLLEEERLSGRQAGAWYRRRWAVEVFYRSLKQTLGHRKMRSDAPEQARCELGWAVMGLWLLSALAVREIVAAGEDPLRLSVASAIKVVRAAMDSTGPPAVSASLRRQLAGALKDRYVRTGPKKARNWSHKKKERPPGKPKIRRANRQEVQWAKELEAKNVAA
jgi:hypothetical protein